MINTVTLNPAIDEIIYLDSFVRNATNRISSKAVAMGGKGTHVSLNLQAMGTTSRAFGFAFGKNGERIVEMLRESGVSTEFISSDSGESRVNLLLVETATRDATLVTEQGPSPTPGMLEQFNARLRERIAPGDLLALSGDASNFADPFIYNRIAEMLADRRVRVFLDASGESLKRGIAQRPFLVKPNRDELSALMGMEIRTEREVAAAIGRLDRLGIEVVVVSMGAEGSIVRADDRLLKVTAPEVEVYNTVGCGDCLVAGLLAGCERGMDTEAILRYATACAAACAESPLSVGFDAARAKELEKRVEIRRI